MLKKIVLAGAIAAALGTPAFAAGELCVDVYVEVNGTPVAVAQCVPLP